MFRIQQKSYPNILFMGVSKFIISPYAVLILILTVLIFTIYWKSISAFIFVLTMHHDVYYFFNGRSIKVYEFYYIISVHINSPNEPKSDIFQLKNK